MVICNLLPTHLADFMSVPERVIALESKMQSIATVVKEPSVPIEGTTAIVIPVDGTLTSAKEQWYFEYLRLVSYDTITQALAEAEANPSYDLIVMDFNSPGGDALGCQEVSAMVSKCNKPVHAYVSGICCSAAYRLAAACQSITATPSAMICNIGTIMAVDKTSSKDYIYSGAHKIDGHVSSAESNARLQQTVDSITAEFEAEVATNRGVPIEDVSATQGAVYTMSLAPFWSYDNIMDSQTFKKELFNYAVQKQG